MKALRDDLNPPTFAYYGLSARMALEVCEGKIAGTG